MYEEVSTEDRLFRKHYINNILLILIYVENHSLHSLNSMCNIDCLKYFMNNKDV